METVSQGQKKYNVCLITIDSCRFDTAQKAHTPSLNSLSKLMCAESHATYTYPSHHSLFIGILPNLINKEDSYLSGYDQVWRSGSVTNTPKKVFEFFTESSIIEHYENNGYNVQGFGGVHFFNPNLGCNSLLSMFSKFTYFGPKEYLSSHKNIPRLALSSPLGNIGKIIQLVDKKEPFFLFINCPETHIPYDIESTTVNEQYIDIIKRLRHEHNRKIIESTSINPFTDQEITMLYNAQINALEYIDKRLKILFEKLPKDHPTLVIVLADHGEEFGEEGRFGHAHLSKYVTTIPVWSGWLSN